jgi:uncharacterized protein YfdQ (DUF2303 family)
MSDENNNTQAALNAGMSIADPSVIIEDHLLLAVLPPGATAKEIDIEKYQKYPSRKRGTFVYDDAESFVAAVVLERTNNATHVFARQDPPRFLAVFNGNGQDYDSPGWADHRADYRPPLSKQWKLWTGKDGDGNKMNQVGFAEFIENNMPDIVTPPGASLLDVVTKLQAKRNVEFASAIRLDNGQVQMTYKEEVSGAASGGQMVIPERFTLGLPVFLNGPKYALNARLRWRLGSGNIAFWFDLERPEQLLEDAFKELRTTVDAGTGIKSLLGMPPNAG